MDHSNYEAILARVDHTVLSPTATWEEIKSCLEDAMHYKTATACIPPAYIELALAWRKAAPACQQVRICTVIGFPNGYNTSASKFNEARDAVSKGADELDVVINLGWVKSKDWESIRHELQALREVTRKHVLKVIIETALLTDQEKIKLCEIVTEVGADYIKTSTGFASGGATAADVRLLREHVGEKVKVKAAGGIRSFEDATAMIDAGADRLGTSRLVSILKEASNTADRSDFSYQDEE